MKNHLYMIVSLWVVIFNNMNIEATQKIRWLQQAEGHRPCFRSGRIICKYEDRCCWAEICDVENNHIKPSIKFVVVDKD